MSDTFQVVDYDGAVDLIHHSGKKTDKSNGITYMLFGKPGVGKTSVVHGLKEKNPKHEVAMIDCANIDLGDLLMPWIDKENKCTRYMPNAQFKFHLKKPLIVALDEITKATQAVQNMLLPLVLEKRIGDLHLEKGSMVLCTGNNPNLNLGDSIKSHVFNRFSTLYFRCPTVQKWCEYAVRNNANPVGIAYIMQHPNNMTEYTDSGQSKNTNIFNPPEGIVKHFLSPRSMMMACELLDYRKDIGATKTLAGLCGLIGQSAAMELNAFIELDDKLPTWEAIIANPSTIEMHEDPVADIITVHKAIHAVTSSTMPKWLEYLTRMAKEKQGMFAKVLQKSNNKNSMACKAFIDWAQENNYLFCKTVK